MNMQFKNGDQVVIPKGTEIRTTGKVKNKIAKTTYRVKIDHILPGICITGSTAYHEFDSYQDQLNKLGITKAFLKELVETDPGTYYTKPTIQIKEPSVRWAGTGGYWHEALASSVVAV